MLRVEQVAVSELTPYARNARTHSEEQVRQIAASIKEFGFCNPVLVDADGTVIAGHGRLLAAEHLGMTEVPVIQLGHLSREQAQALRLADNQLALNAGWDEELLNEALAALHEIDADLTALIGFSEDVLDRALGRALDEDATPDLPENPVSRTGDLWRLGEHRLLCGDCTSAGDVQRLMGDERAILFATDPPYLVDYDGTNHPRGNKDWSGSYGNTWDDARAHPDLYDGFIRAAIDHAIKPNAAWYCWHASPRQAMVEDVWAQHKAFVHQQIIWVKNRPVMVRMQYLWQHEPCFFGWRRGHKPPRVSRSWERTVWEIPLEEQDLHTTVWRLQTPTGKDRPEHATPKPIECFGIPMRQHVRRGGLCYEPFSGSGSQIMAGEENGRRVYAMEIEPAYVDVTVRRWEAATGQAATLDGADATTFAALAAERNNGAEH